MTNPLPLACDRKSPFATPMPCWSEQNCAWHSLLTYHAFDWPTGRRGWLEIKPHLNRSVPRLQICGFDGSKNNKGEPRQQFESKETAEAELRLPPH